MFDLFDQVTITNPARPHWGTVCVTDDVAIWWRCQVRAQAHGTGGIELADIASTIARALISADTVRPEPQY